jgi:TetR/AcrR family transcriptional regulator, tetracycline repressor protein
MSTEPPARTPLTRERIVRAALALVDEAGLGALTMRRLGAELGVEAMSLYKHVAGKEAILDGIRELLIAEFAATLPPGPATGWRDDLARFARAYRSVGRAHPEAFALLASAPGRAYVAGSGLAEQALERLVAEGLGREDAIRAQRTVTRFVLGTSLLERAAGEAPSPVGEPELAALSADRPLLGDLMRALGTSTDDALFEFGLEALLGGIGLMVAGASAPGG